LDEQLIAPCISINIAERGLRHGSQDSMLAPGWESVDILILGGENLVKIE